VASDFCFCFVVVANFSPPFIDPSNLAIMKSKYYTRFLSPQVLAMAFAASTTSLYAQSGTWTATTNGPNNWSTASQWSGSTVANGISNTATFGSDIGQLSVVNLDSSRTIGNMVFSDNALNGSPRLLQGAVTLTVDNGASQAVITKTTATTISTPLAASNIRFNGNANINLLGNNTGITGTVTLGGTNGVTLGNSNALGSAAISIVNGEVPGGTTRGIVISNPITLGTYFWQGGFGLTLNGTLTLTGANQGFQTWAAATDTVQAGAVSLGANTLNVQGNAVGGIRISGNISGTGGVTKVGTSTLSLSGSNSYTGTSTVTVGRLNFNPSANTSNLSVSGTGTILGGEGSSSNAMSLGAGSILTVDPSTTAALGTTAALSISGAVTLALEPTQSMTAGTNVVDVIKYGTFSGTELANLTLPSGIRSGVLADDTVNSKITLSLETGTRTWNGSAEFTDWDALATENWNEGDKKFAVGDSVVFDDSAAVAGSVYVVGKLTPASLVFNHSTQDYTLIPVNTNANENEITGGTSLVKSGTGLLTITHTNSYTGGTMLNEGTLSFTNGGLGTYGAITMNGGTLQWEGANTQDISRRLTLVDGQAATFLVGGTSDVRFNTSLGGSTATTASVVKNGSGTLTLNNSFSAGTYSGGTTINGGTLSLGTGGTGNPTCSVNALGTGAVSINAGGRLRLWIQNTHTHNFINNLSINGGRLHGEDGIYNVNGTIAVGTLGATLSGVWGGKNLVINGVISGDGPVTIESASSQVRFFANNTYTGATTISTGSLLLNGTDATSGYTVATGASLVLRSANITGDISGPGTVTKDISTYGSSTINGTNNTYTGATTVNIDRFTVGAAGVINGTSSITVQAQWGANFNNLGSVTTPGNVTVAGSGNTTGGGLATDSSTFRNAGTLNAASLLLNSSASTNTTANRGGTFTQTTGTTTLSTAATLSANGGTGAAGTAGNDTALNLNGGSFTAPTIAINAGTLNANGGTLTLGAAGLTSAGTNAIAVNFGATTLAASAAWTTTLPAALTNSTTGTTIDTTGGNITLGGALTGSGNLIKAGAGTLLISAANTFTGTTTVNAGVLAVDGDSLADAGDLIIDGGAVAPSGGTEVVNKLFFGGVQQAAGTWGASGSGATNIDNTRFTGTGVVSVTTGPIAGYAFWASSNANSQAANLDADGDGVANGVEYFLGATGLTFTANPQPDASKTITWTNGGNISSADYGSKFVVQVSDDLSTWTDVPLVGVVNTASALSYTLTGSGKQFARLVVTP
jgi:autotransporter-associated beta strand protein